MRQKSQQGIGGGMVQADIEATLKEIGLSKNEAKVYFRLSELGQATPNQIADKGDIHRTNVYDAVTKLINKGLVTYCFIDGKKRYTLSDPENLMNLIREKETKVKNLMPLLSVNKQLNSDVKVHMFEGMRGIKMITEQILAQKDMIFAFGMARDVAEKMNAFLSLFHERRIKQKSWMFHIYNYDGTERVKFLNTIQYSQAALLGLEYESVATTTVCGKLVTNFIWTDPPMGILIDDERMAQTYRNYFKLLWRMATGTEWKIPNKPLPGPPPTKKQKS